MMYVAKCYVSIAGRVLRPGDAFEAETEDAKISRLLRMNAIAAVKPKFVPTPDEQQNGTDDAEANRENYHAQMENLGYEASGDPPDAQEPVTEEEPVTEDEPSDEECDDAEEAPEIDAMDGVVAPAEEAPAETPVKKTTGGRKKA